MNTVLLLCQRCHEICGCTEPRTKACEGCASHDCPVLPAPRVLRGYCRLCTSHLHAFHRADGWVGLPVPSGSQA